MNFFCKSLLSFACCSAFSVTSLFNVNIVNDIDNINSVNVDNVAQTSYLVSSSVALRDLLSTYSVNYEKLFSMSSAEASSKRHKELKDKQNQKEIKGTILFVPHDNRPTSCEISTEAVEKSGYRVLMPDKALLGDINNPAKVDKLWEWTNDNISKADAAVISSDSLIYGGLVSSRKHELTADELKKRLNNIAELKKNNPFIKLYAFGSLMRTPKSGLYSGGEEPEYYLTYGEDIFKTTALLDKASMVGLTPDEDARMNYVRSKVPSDVWSDWLGRREKNLNVTKQLIDMDRNGTLDYFIIGKDDNAPLSATHHEANQLENYSRDLSSNKFELTAGIDEFAMLLLSRAVNDHEKIIPGIYVQYNIGKGGDTVPAFSDEKISSSIAAEMAIAGAVPAMYPDKADFVLLVNTNPLGNTGDGVPLDDDPHPLWNDGQPRYGTDEIFQQIKDYVAAGYKVGVADVAFANGADNALMNKLRDNNLLFKLRGYAGWNTPTNSSGFVIGQGLLNCKLKDEDCDRILLERYLDDWAYQSNVRPELMHQLDCLRVPGVLLHLDCYTQGTMDRATYLMRQFVSHNLPPFNGLNDLTMSFPWNNTFIGRVNLPDKIDGVSLKDK